MKQGLSIIMPCLNEEKTLAICIHKAWKALEEMQIAGEVIVADNGSTDKSIEIAKESGAKVIHISEKGYGSALRGGIDAAQFEYIIMGDADDSYDFLDISRFVDKLNEGYDLVMGNRFKGGIKPGAMSFSHRYIGNPFLSGLGRVFFKTNIGDFHCGLRAFRRESIEKIGLCTTGMEFASEMVVKSVLFNLKIAEVPCVLYPDGRDRPPHLRSIPDGLRHLEFLLLYSPKWLFAYPGLLFTIVGLVLAIGIYIQPIQVGRVQFEVTTMLYSALLMLIGIQFVAFSFFTGIFAERIGQIPQATLATKKVTSFISKRGYQIAWVIIAIGLCGVIYTLFAWGQEGFGQLNSTGICKTAILFGSLLAVGIENLLLTLFTRVLQIGISRDEK